MLKILMVCMGNICRSPMAEAVARAMAERRNLGALVEFDSAGTHVYHAGDGPDERARQVALRRGYSLAGLKARKLVTDDFQRFDLLLAMDKQNLSALMRRCPEVHAAKLKLVLEYAQPEVAEMGEIPDPYYGNIEGFERVLDLCELAAGGLLDEIKRVVESR